MLAKLIDALPELVAELKQLLNQEHEPMLADQVASLGIVDRYPCKDDFCAKFYTEPRPQGAYGSNHRNVILAPERGMIIVDVVAGKIAAVEILHRDEIRKALGTLMK